jgi:transposase
VKWDTLHRKDQERSRLRFATDLTDREWQIVEPLLPPPRRGGRPRTVDLREVLNTILYVLESGRGWDDLPKQFPPKSTVYDYFTLWRSDRTLRRLHRALWQSSGAADGRC